MGADNVLGLTLKSKKGEIGISTWTGQRRRLRKRNDMEAERSRQEVVPTAAFAGVWREISGYGEHSERASLRWAGWKLAEISH